jgi:hypothetical protein
LAAVALLAAGGLASFARSDERPLLVIVPAQRSDTPNADEISLIFKRRKLFWEDGSRIQAVNLPPDHPLRQRFSRSILKMSSDALETYWNQQYFNGVVPPHVLASEAAMLRFVADTPSAIGYVSACQPDSRVRVILLISADGRVLPLESAPVCN